MTQKLSFPGIGSGSVWLQHGPYPALASELGIALSSTIIKEPPWQRVGGAVSGGQDVCTGGEWACWACLQSGGAAGSGVAWRTERGEAGVADWSLMVGGPAIGGWDKDLYFPHWNGRL